MIRESPELRAIIERLFGALQHLDGATGANMFLRAPSTRYVGSDPKEWWSGSEFVDAYPKHVAGWPTPAIDVIAIEAFESGQVGWAAAQAMWKWGEAEVTLTRMTFVLILEAGIWRIVQMHNSLGVSNVDWIGVELTGALELLVAAIEAPHALDVPIRDGTVSLVFTDIEDSTQMAMQLGDTAWVKLLNGHHRALEEAAGRRGGTIVKTLGDGAMISFSSTRDAVRAAIDIQQRQVEPQTQQHLSVRIGVHVGDAISRDSDYFGTTVNKAARIAAAAEGGQIMVSDAVRVLLGDSAEFVFGDPTTVKLKGLDGLHQVTPVAWQAE
jgi:class 3 adenylate cyclase